MSVKVGFDQTSLVAFNARIKRFAKDLLPRQHVTFQKKLVMDALAGIVFRTPVDTGALRGAWLVTTGSPASGVGSPDKSGNGPLASGQAAIAGLSFGQAVFITNNKVYALSIEQGHSKQAPSGMVAVTFAGLGRTVR